MRCALLSALVAYLACGAALAADCSDTTTSIIQARQAIDTNDPEQQRTALACLVEAVAALDAKLTAFTTGKATFDGPIFAPRGVIFDNHTSASLNHVDAHQHRATEEAR